MISSYPSIYAVGHKYIAELFNGPVLVEEKIDGSQFSFGVEATLIGGIELKCRSKGQEIYPSAPEKMFNHAVATATKLYQDGLLRVGWTYRCEYLQKPKHNCLSYARVPKQHLILFDIQTGPEAYLSVMDKHFEAQRIGLEVVPSYYFPADRSPQELEKFFECDSILGGCKIEGVVVKNYNHFGIDKKILIGKFVSAAFKEKHAGEWKKSNPTKADVVEFLVSQLRTDARWRKAIAHLREAGKITDTPQDIGPLLLEIKKDIEREEADSVKEALFKHFWPQIARGATAGFPEWYKKELGILNVNKTDTAMNEDIKGLRERLAVANNPDEINRLLEEGSTYTDASDRTRAAWLHTAARRRVELASRTPKEASKEDRGALDQRDKERRQTMDARRLVTQ